MDAEVAEKLSKVHFDYLKLHYDVNLQWECNIVKFNEILERNWASRFSALTNFR